MNQLGIGSGTGFIWIVNVFFLLLFVAFWVVVIYFIVWAVRRLTEPRAGNVSSRSAIEIAKERYARGEITREQFDQLKKDLS